VWRDTGSTTRTITHSAARPRHPAATGTKRTGRTVPPARRRPRPWEVGEPGGCSSQDRYCWSSKRAARRTDASASRRGGVGNAGLNNVEVIYDGVMLVLKGVSLNVREGGITTVLGANGAGKKATAAAAAG